MRRISSPFAAHSFARCAISFLIATSFLLDSSGLAAENGKEVREIEIPEKGALSTVFMHFYPKWIAPEHILKLVIESQISGVRRSRAVVLELIGSGARQEYYFPYGISVL